MEKTIHLLDCTLRDGGYVNDWKWGFETARRIINFLVRANIDVIEVGFLRNIAEYSPDITVCNRIEELNRLLPAKNINSAFSAMAMRSNYDVSKLSDYSGEGIELIRVTAHENDINEGIEFANVIKNKGYKISINPINIMGYSDDALLRILEKVNKVHPYQFAIVDTFGSMKRRDLDRIVSLVDHNLDKDIRVAVHLHENMAQSFCCAQNFVDKHLDRPTALDGSLFGMGRIPGNLPIELIADYLNDYCDKNYDIDYLLDAIQDHIGLIKGDPKWGYNPAYFLSARYNLHRNYAEYYLNKGDLIARDINHLLSRFDRAEAAVFNESYAEKKYREYKDNYINDISSRKALKKAIGERDILILAPGKSLLKNKDLIKDFINSKKPVVISVNFYLEEYPIDYLFYGNNRRYSQIGKGSYRSIATSNVNGEFDYYINYSSVSSTFKQGNNALVMLILLLKSMGWEEISVAGADGYKEGEHNYFSINMRSDSERGMRDNLEIANAIKKTGMHINYITESMYQKY